MSDSSILDMELDDLADLPEFKVFPPGAYTVTISWEEKEINKNPSLELGLKLIAVQELADVSDVPPNEGDECSALFNLSNEYGVGNLKKILKPLKEHFGVGRTGDLIEASQGAECLVVTKLRADKNDKDKKYMDIVSLTVL